MERGSGILTLKTAYMKRPRLGPKLFRPRVLWSLCLMLAAAALTGVAVVHRASVDRRLAEAWRSGSSVPFEVQKLRHDLADLEIDEETLTRELDTRLDYIANAENDDFSIVLDTRTRRFTLRLGEDVLREAPLTIGAVAPIKSRTGRSWTFAPLTGAFTVKGKAISPAWKAPEWVYVADGRPVPDPLPSLAGALGKYVVELEGDYVIHSPPPPDSPLQGAKPGSFLVPEADLAAVWKRITPRTRVYVF